VCCLRVLSYSRSLDSNTFSHYSHSSWSFIVAASRSLLKQLLLPLSTQLSSSTTSNTSNTSNIFDLLWSSFYLCFFSLLPLLLLSYNYTTPSLPYTIHRLFHTAILLIQPLLIHRLDVCSGSSVSRLLRSSEPNSRYLCKIFYSEHRPTNDLHDRSSSRTSSIKDLGNRSSSSFASDATEHSSQQVFFPLLC
jgi:hypothetical protein